MIRLHLSKYLKLKKQGNRQRAVREIVDYDLEDAAPEEHHPLEE